MRILILSIFIVLGITTAGYAHPPTSIDLAYSLEEGVLTIDIKHVSSNPRAHHIRKVIVYKNDEEATVLRFATQSSAKGTIEEVSLGAQVGDEIAVEAICNEAGRKTATIAVSETPSQEE